MALFRFLIIISFALILSFSCKSATANYIITTPFRNNAPSVSFYRSDHSDASIAHRRRGESCVVY